MRLNCVCVLKLTFAFLGATLLRGAEFEITETPLGVPAADFLSVYSLNGNRVWASADPVGPWIGSTDDGAKGSVYISNNGGDTWSRHPAINGPTLENLHFVNSQKGFASTRSFLLRTSDGGMTWQSTTFSSAGEADELFVLDENHIWGVWSNEAYRSTNGGNSWVEFPIDASGGLFFLNKNVGFMGGDFFLTKTTDGGDTWDLVPYPNAYDGVSIHFFDEDKGFVLTRKGELLATFDGGDSWGLRRLIVADDLEYRFTKILFLDNNVGFAIGDKIYKTSNGGSTWEAKTSEELRGFKSIHFSDNLRGFAVGEGSVVARTTDGGDTWLVERIGTPNIVSDIEFITESDGWAIWDGSLFATESGGLRWTRVELPDKADSSVFDVEVLPDGSAWVVGGDGKIWSKAVNSADWAAQSSGFSETLTNVRFFENEIGWIAGVETLLRTVDAGMSWESRLPESASELSQFYALSRNTVYHSAAYIDSELNAFIRETFKTDDGGESWIKIDAVIPLAFDFLNECLGIYVSSAVSITSDAGKSWEEVTTNLSSATVFDFVSDSVGYIAGEAGRLRKVTVEGAAESLVGTFATDVETAFPMTLIFDTEVGKKYIVEYSVDMINWEGWCDRITATATSTQWTEDNWSPESFADSGRYYRVLRVDE